MDGSTAVSSEVDRLVETLLQPASSTMLQNGTRVMFCELGWSKVDELAATDNEGKRRLFIERQLECCHCNTYYGTAFFEARDGGKGPALANRTGGVG